MAGIRYIALIIAVSALVCVLAEEEGYPAKFDNFDVRGLLQNDELREGYYNCFMETGPCTPEQSEAMPIFVDALITKCRKCSNKLKENMEIGREWYKTNAPEKWKLVIEKLNELKKKSTP